MSGKSNNQSISTDGKSVTGTVDGLGTRLISLSSRIDPYSFQPVAGQDTAGVYTNPITGESVEFVFPASNKGRVISTEGGKDYREDHPMFWRNAAAIRALLSKLKFGPNLDEYNAWAEERDEKVSRRKNGGLIPNPRRK